MTEEQESQPMPPKKLAFIIDGEVADVLHTDERLSAIFLSEPLIIDITEEMSKESDYVIPGATYNYETKEFTNPERLLPPSQIIGEA